jgi:hypothetical protein
LLDTHERNLINIYHSGSREATAAVMREALPDMEPDVRVAAESVIRKLEAMSGGDFDNLISGEAAP